MGGYYRLGAQDARRLGAMVGALSTGRSRVHRATMALYCWSQMQAKGVPCPHFRCGIRTVAKACGVTPRTAQRFMELMESEGHVVSLGEETNRGGRYRKRTFWWVAEEAAEAAGMGLDEWLAKVVGVSGKVHTGVHEKVHTPANISQQNGAHRCAPTPKEAQLIPAALQNGCTHQSTEYSEGDAPPASSESAAARPSLSEDGIAMPPRPDWPS